MSSKAPPQKVPKKYTGIMRIIKAAGYSKQGIFATWKSEAAFRQECLIALFVIPTVLLCELSSLQRILLISSTAFVLIIELLNSSIEALVDRVGAEYHELSGKAKDIGSAAVMLSIVLWIYIWTEVFILQ